MRRNTIVTLMAMTILWLSGMNAGEGRWLVSFLEIIIFYLVMAYGITKED